MNDGGTAFPSGMIRKIRQRPGDAGSDFFVHEFVEAKEPGMSLRDWFAGMALQGWLATYGDSAHPARQGYGKRLAEDAYVMADEMLKAREEPKPT